MQIGSIQGGAAGMPSAVAKTPSAVSLDPKDTNQDGVVSAAEEMAYAQKHLAVKIQEAPANNVALSQYGQNGALSATASLAGRVDGYA